MQNVRNTTRRSRIKRTCWTRLLPVGIARYIIIRYPEGFLSIPEHVGKCGYAANVYDWLDGTDFMTVLPTVAKTEARVEDSSFYIVTSTYQYAIGVEKST